MMSRCVTHWLTDGLQELLELLFATKKLSSKSVVSSRCLVLPVVLGVEMTVRGQSGAPEFCRISVLRLARSLVLSVTLPLTIPTQTSLLSKWMNELTLMKLSFSNHSRWVGGSESSLSFISNDITLNIQTVRFIIFSINIIPPPTSYSDEILMIVLSLVVAVEVSISCDPQGKRLIFY